MADLVTIRALFLEFPTEPAVEEWSFYAEPGVPEGDGPEVDERGLELELRREFQAAGGANTLSIGRHASSGGWGASGLSVLEIAVSVSAGVASNALWSTIVALFKKYVGTDPQTSRERAPAQSPGLPTARAVTKPPKALPKKGKKRSRARRRA